MSDLFDGVKPPKEERREAPQPAAAPTVAREAAPGATKGTERSGVPVSRLWWWVAPLLLVVAVVALWSVSVWLLVAVAAAALLGVLVVALAWWLQRRRTGRLARTRLWTSGPAGRTTGSSGRVGSGGRGNGIARGLGLGGRTSRSGNGSNGHRTGTSRPGSRWSPFRSAGRGSASGAGRSGRGGPAAGTDGRSGRGRAGLGGRFRWPGTGRRSGASGGSPRGHAADGSAGVGRRGRGAKTSSPFPAGVGGRPGSRWSRSRANPATWWGPRRAAAKAARSSEERRKRRPEGEKTTPAATKRESKAAKAPESSRRRKWTWRRKKKAAGASKPGDSDKAADGDATSTGADTKKSTDAKGSTDPKKDSAKSPTATASPAPDTTKTVPRITRQPKPSVPKPSEAPAFKDDVLLFDEMGFPTRPNPAPRTPPSTNSGARKPVTATPVVTAPAATIQRSSNMSDTVDNPYAHLIDSSSKATFRASTREAADQARKDAQEREEKAAKLRGQAQSWIEKGSDDIAQPLLQEAARLEEDASTRRQAAAAYESV